MNMIAAFKAKVAAIRTARIGRAARERARQDAFMRDVSFEDALAIRHGLEADGSQKTIDVLHLDPLGVHYRSVPTRILDFTGSTASDDGPPEDDTVEDLRKLHQQHPEKF